MAGSHPQPRLFGAGLPSRAHPHLTRPLVRPKSGLSNTVLVGPVSHGNLVVRPHRPHRRRVRTTGGRKRRTWRRARQRYATGWKRSLPRGSCGEQPAPPACEGGDFPTACSRALSPPRVPLREAFETLDKLKRHRSRVPLHRWGLLAFFGCAATLAAFWAVCDRVGRLLSLTAFATCFDAATRLGADLTLRRRSPRCLPSATATARLQPCLPDDRERTHRGHDSSPGMGTGRGRPLRRARGHGRLHPRKPREPRHPDAEAHRIRSRSRSQLRAGRPPGLLAAGRRVRLEAHSGNAPTTSCRRCGREGWRRSSRTRSPRRWTAATRCTCRWTSTCWTRVMRPGPGRPSRVAPSRHGGAPRRARRRGGRPCLRLGRHHGEQRPSRRP